MKMQIACETHKKKIEMLNRVVFRILSKKMENLFENQ